MIRPSRALAGVGAGCAVVALVLAAPAPAFAFEITWDGDQNVAWSNPDNWAGGAVPQGGDTLIFPVAGVHGYSDNELANPFFADHLEITGDAVNIAGWPISITAAGTQGIRVAAQDVVISPELRFNGYHTVRVEAGASVSFPSNIRIESGFTTFDIEGTASIGQLDGVGFVGGAEKTGAGVLTIVGAGGIAGGFDVVEGTVFLVGNGAGTAWNLGGGASITGYGQMERLNAEQGSLAPGDAADGAGTHTLTIWNAFTATTDTILDFDVTAVGYNDSIYTLEGTQVDGAVLSLNLEEGTAPGTQWAILEQERDLPFSWTFTTPDGAAIVEGEEFTSNGQTYTLETIDRTVVVTYLGPALVPVVPTGPTMPATGLDASNTIPLVAIALGALALGAGVLFGLRRRRQSLEG